MKRFVYRGKAGDGSPVSGVVDAPDRDAAFRELRGRRILMTSLPERETSGGDARSRKKRVGIAAFLALAVITTGGFLWKTGARNSSSHEPFPSVKQNTTLLTPGKRAPTREKNPKAEASEEGSSRRTEPLPGQTDALAARSGRTPHGERRIPRPKPLKELTPPPRPKAFETGAEQLLAMVTPAAPGARVPPLPALTDEGMKEDVLKALNTTIVIRTNDSERLAALKENVADPKEEFRALNQTGGWTFVEYLTALREKHTEDADFLQAAHREFNDLWYDENVSDEQLMKRFGELNKELQARGLPLLE